MPRACSKTISYQVFMTTDKVLKIGDYLMPRKHKRFQQLSTLAWQNASKWCSGNQSCTLQYRQQCLYSKDIQYPASNYSGLPQHLFMAVTPGAKWTHLNTFLGWCLHTFQWNTGSKHVRRKKKKDPRRKIHTQGHSVTQLVWRVSYGGYIVEKLCHTKGCLLRGISYHFSSWEW